MINDDNLYSLHTNQRLLVQELQRRGVEVDLLVHELELLEARYAGHVEFLLDRDSSICPYPASIICANKYLTKRILLRAGISTPRGEQFFPDQLAQALAYADSLKSMLVVKPSIGSHGIGCSTDIKDVIELKQAIDRATVTAELGGAFLIEEQCPGMEFRVFVTRNGDYAVLHRDPAHVIGDGRSSIRVLAERESQRRINPRKNCLCPIVIDDVVKTFLLNANLSLDSVPAQGAKIYLRRNSNVALGGSCEDYTASAHPSSIDIAKRALAAMPGLPYAGVDILSTDIAAAQTKESYSVLEINSNPGLHMHMRPGRGEGRNVAAYLADLIFPEAKVGGH